jgi:hypothetical protein
LLLVATLGAVGYLLVGRSGGAGNPNDLVHVDQRIARDARSLPYAAQRVQRFTELHQFDAVAVAVIAEMDNDVAQLQHLSAADSGSGRTIIDASVAAAQQAIDAAGRFRHAVAFSYRLANADTARQDLFAAATTLDQEVKAWAGH